MNRYINKKDRFEIANLSFLFIEYKEKVQKNMKLLAR